ncbi:hypothetical protein RHODOSMS8_03355 [Rhodobiaceae bacterium]|nr:hypothetical protein RHODOSMS8_03355 [Rhodobiaceae bacterium]
MGNAPSTSRVVGIILMVAGIVAIPLAAYYLFYVTGQQDFQTRRSLRAVHEITVQLNDRFAALHQIMRFFPVTLDVRLESPGGAMLPRAKPLQSLDRTQEETLSTERLVEPGACSLIGRVAKWGSSLSRMQRKLRDLTTLWEWQCHFVRGHLSESGRVEENGQSKLYRLLDSLTEFIPSLSAPLYQAIVDTGAPDVSCRSLNAARTWAAADGFANEEGKSDVLEEVVSHFVRPETKPCPETETDNLPEALRNLELLVEKLGSELKTTSYNSDYEVLVNSTVSLISLHEEILKRAIALQELGTHTQAELEEGIFRLASVSDAHIFYLEFLCASEGQKIIQAESALQTLLEVLKGNTRRLHDATPCLIGNEDNQAIERAARIRTENSNRIRAEKIAIVEEPKRLEIEKLARARVENLTKAKSAEVVPIEEIARVEGVTRSAVGDGKRERTKSEELIEPKTDRFAGISNPFRVLVADQSSRENALDSSLRVLPQNQIMKHVDTSSTLRTTRWFRRLETHSSAIETLSCDESGVGEETFLRFTSEGGMPVVDGGLRCSGDDLSNFSGRQKRWTGGRYILTVRLGDLIDVPARSSQDMRFAIADCNGRIVFGNLDGGSTVNNLSHWLGLSPSTAKTGEKDAEIRPFALFSTATVNASIEDDALAHSRVETIFLGGQQYQAAIQPYRLPIGVSDPSCEQKPSNQPTASARPSSPNESPQNESPQNESPQNQATWFVVGLTPYDKIVRETRNPPFLVVAWTVPLVFLGLLTWPYLTFRFAGSGLNLGRLHLTVTAISLPVGFGLLSLLLFAFYHYQLEQTKVVVEAKAISKSLSAAFSHELDETLEMMVGDASSVDENDQTVSEVSFGQLALLESAENLLSAFDRCRNLLLMNRSKVDATGEGDRWDWRCQWAAESAAADERQTFEQFTRGYQSFEFAWMMDGTPGSPAEGRHVGPHLSLRETAVRRVALGNRGYFQRARNREGWRREALSAAQNREADGCEISNGTFALERIRTRDFGWTLSSIAVPVFSEATQDQNENKDCPNSAGSPRAFWEKSRFAEEAVLRTPMSAERAPSSFVLAIVKRIQTFASPVLPYGFGFAVVRDRTGDQLLDGQAWRRGDVLFHSDDSRSLIENFLGETDNDINLEAALENRRSDTIEVPYRGRPHLIHVDPLAGLPWSLIVFYDKSILHLSLTEPAIAATMSFMVFAIFLALIAGAGVSLAAGYKAWAWIWPRPRSTSTYYTATGVLVLVGLSLVLIACVMEQLPFPYAWFLLGGVLLAVLGGLIIFFSPEQYHLKSDPKKADDIVYWKVIMGSRLLLTGSVVMILGMALFPLAVGVGVAFFELTLANEPLAKVVLVVQLVLSLVMPMVLPKCVRLALGVFDHGGKGAALDASTQFSFAFFLMALIFLFGIAPASVIWIDAERLASDIRQKHELVHAGEATYRRESEILADLKRLQPEALSGVRIEDLVADVRLWTLSFHNRRVCVTENLPAKQGSVRSRTLYSVERSASGFFSMTSDEYGSAAPKECPDVAIRFDSSHTPSRDQSSGHFNSTSMVAPLYDLAPPYTDQARVMRASRGQAAADGSWSAIDATLSEDDAEPRTEGLYHVAYLPSSDDSALRTPAPLALLVLVFFLGMFLWSLFRLSTSFAKVSLGLKTMPVCPYETDGTVVETKLGEGKTRILIAAASSKDLETCLDEKKVAPGGRAQQIDLAAYVSEKGTAQQQKQPSKLMLQNATDGRLVVTGLEGCFWDKETSERAVSFLEEIACNAKLQIVLCCEVDPRPYLTLIWVDADKDVEAAEAEGKGTKKKRNIETLPYRWNNLLSTFDVVGGHRLMVAPSPGGTETCQRKVKDLIECEYRGPWHDELKQAIDELIPPSGTPVETPTAHEIKEQLASKAWPAYRRVWLALAREEKLLLVHLSRGRLVNMSNERVLLSLAKSRLVKMAPYPQIVTPSFELFIRRAETDKTIAAWEEKAGMGLWSVIRIPFFAVILLGVMFLAVTTPESFQALLAIVATATAGIPLILRAFSGVGGSRAG